MNLATFFLDAVIYGFASVAQSLVPAPPAFFASAFDVLGQCAGYLCGMVDVDIWYPVLVAAVVWRMQMLALDVLLVAFRIIRIDPR
jgi:hypothetical protein